MRKKIGEKQIMMAVAGVFAVAGTLLGGAMAPAESRAVSCPSGAVRSSADNAADCNVPEPQGSGSEGQRVNNIVKSVVNVLVAIAGMIAVFVIIYGGFQILTSAGDAGKVKTGRTAIIYGVVGLVVAVGAWLLVNFIFVVAGSGSGTGSGSSGG